MKFKLQKVRFMPNNLDPGILYVSDEFCTAAHLCACGCGTKIRTPLGPTEWSVEATETGPTLYPSVGNWQQSCQSHYWITGGEIHWAETWTAEQIAEGRRCEELRRREYFSGTAKSVGPVVRCWNWIKNILKRWFG